MPSGAATDGRRTVAVVGLGIYGSSVAAQLAKRVSSADVRVVGLEMYDAQHPFGSSHGGTRMCRISNFESVQYIPTALRSIEILTELQKDPAVAAHLAAKFPPSPQGSDKREAPAPCLFRSNGVVFFGPKEDILTPTHGEMNPVKQTVAVADEYNASAPPERRFRYQILTGAELRQRFPYFTLRREGRGDDEQLGDMFGFYEPQAGTMFPERCIAAMQFDARRHGAELHFNVRVAGVRQLPDGRATLSVGRPAANGGAVAAAGDTLTEELNATPFDEVVLCAGPWIHSVLPRPLHTHFTLERHLFAWLETTPGAATDAFSMDKGHAPNFVRFAIRHKTDGVTSRSLVGGRQHVDFFYGFPSNLSYGETVKVAQELASPITCIDDHVLARPQPYGKRRATTSYRDVDDEEVDAMLNDVRPYLGSITGRIVRKAACAYTVQPNHKFVVDWVPAALLDGHVGTPEQFKSPVLVVSACSGHGFKHAACIAEGIARSVARRVGGASAVETRPWPVLPFEVGQRAAGSDDYAWRPTGAKL